MPDYYRPSLFFLTLYVLGDYINIVGEFDIKHTIVVDKDSNFVVTYPDLLIPVTTLSESFACSRRAVLNNRIKPAQKEKGDALVYGTMLHLIFQKCLKARTFERAFIIEEIEGVIASSEEDIYLIGRGVDQVRDFLIPHVATLQAWARAYLDPAYLVVSRNRKKGDRNWKLTRSPPFR